MSLSKTSNRKISSKVLSNTNSTKAFSTKKTTIKSIGSLSISGGSIFTISPAVNGRTSWDLSVDGVFDLPESGTWTLTPQNTFSTTVKIWGAGGGANNGYGGGGGSASSIIQFVQGTSYTLIVGAPGVDGSASTGSGGGGGTGIHNGSTHVLIAGGGGGAHSQTGTAGQLADGGGVGGAGGGTSGLQGWGDSNGASGGGGGTQSAGGAAASTSRSAGAAAGGSPGSTTGGSGGRGAGSSSSVAGGIGYGNGGAGWFASGDTGGCGGGGGYYGGGGGGHGGWGGGTGGGGSGYYNPSLTSSAVLYTGSGRTPGNSEDFYRITAGNSRNPGRIVLVPSSAPTKDPYFNYVSLLLNSSSSNALQNNTFIDSSALAATLTRSGNTTQGSFTPYGTQWSTYFDGTGDYLDIANVSTDFGTSSDFTVEFWIYPTVIDGALKAIIDPRSSDTSAHPVVWINTDNTLYYYTTGSNRILGKTVLIANRWYHVALVRYSGTTTLYLDGTNEGSWADTSNYLSATTFRIGQRYTGTAYNYSGYISNLRVVKGTALYTKSFNPTTSYLTAITNTVLLTCHANRFIDGSSDNRTVTKNGDAKITSYSPFSPSSTYSTASLGGSGYFDGTGDRLTFPATGAFAKDTFFGSGKTFTVEAWIYPTSLVTEANYFSIILGDGNPTGTEMCWSVGMNDAQKPAISWYDGTPKSASVSTALTLNAWTHVAWIASSGSVSIYVNGVSQALSGTTTLTNSSQTVGMEIAVDRGRHITGYISDLRATTTTVYTANFTPPASPVGEVTNTKLLLNFRNHGIYDDKQQHVLETSGNVQTSTSVKNFGGSSIYFDGTGDYLIVPNAESLQMGSKDFTIEFWIRFSSITGYQTPFSKGYTATGDLLLQTGNGTGRLIVYASGSAIITETGTATTNTWIHYALVRSGSTITLYRDGISSGSATNTANFNTSDRLGIGAAGKAPAGGAIGDYPINGYITDLRITKGHARYTANFTAPTTTFPRQ